MSRAPKRALPGVSPFWWLHSNGHDLAGLTGSDTQALIAIAACWDLSGFCDERGKVIAAIAELLDCVQEKYHHLARELIAKSLDWGDRDRLWPLVELERHQRRLRAMP
jgi:hypothetical protein